MRTLIRALLLCALAASLPAQAQTRTKMVIATGVDPSFSAYYVAREAGLFEKHGLDVQLNTGASGSAMVSFVIKNQVQSAFGAEQAGIQNFNLDNDVVVVAEGTELLRWHAIVGRNIADMDGLKGKRVGVAPGTGSEEFWLAVMKHKKLTVADYKVVHVDAPEMIAALERNDIDAFTAWEPWVTRGMKAVPNTKVLQGPEGILAHSTFIYMNRGWIEKNPAAAKAFVTALAEATDLIGSDRPTAAGHVARFLKLDRDMTVDLMTKLSFDLRLAQSSVDNLRAAEETLAQIKKLQKPVVWDKFIYPDLLKQVRPEKVTYKLP